MTPRNVNLIRVFIYDEILSEIPSENGVFRDPIKVLSISFTPNVLGYRAPEMRSTGSLLNRMKKREKENCRYIFFVRLSGVYPGEGVPVHCVTIGPGPIWGRGGTGEMDALQLPGLFLDSVLTK